MTGRVRHQRDPLKRCSKQHAPARGRRASRAGKASPRTRADAAMPRRGTARPRPIILQMLMNWCGREDSNLHALRR
jgi:hypothetical protein